MKPEAQEQSRTQNLLTLTASVGCFTLQTGSICTSERYCQRYFSKIQCLRRVATRRKIALPTMSALLSFLEVPCDLGTEVQNRLCQHMQDAETEGNLAHIHATEHELRIGQRGLRETDASQRKSKMNCSNQGKESELFTTKLFQPDKCQGQFCSLESESDSHRRLIRHKSAAANLRLYTIWKSAFLAKVNVTSKRTAEVTISIALDSYRIPI